MTVYAISSNGLVAAGVAVFNGLQESGEDNLYAVIASSLAPYNFSGEDNVTLAWKVTLRVEGRMNVLDYSNISALEGYPDRYRLGQFSYLIANRPFPVFFIDTIDWCNNDRRALWYTPAGLPVLDFYNDPPTTVTPFDTIVALTTPFGISANWDSMPGVTGFSWSLPDMVEMTLNFHYSAIRLDYATNPDPAPDIFWQFN